MAQRIWISSVVATLALLGYVQCQDATACDALHACINVTASTADGVMSAYPDLPDAEKQAMCEKVFDVENGVVANLTACATTLGCADGTAMARLAEVATQTVLALNYTCMAGIYHHADPCVGASYCLGNVTNVIKQDIEAKSAVELQAACGKLMNNESVPEWDMEQCAIMTAFCADTTAMATLMNGFMALHAEVTGKCVTSGEEAGGDQSIDIDESLAPCTNMFGKCIIDLQAAFKDKVEFALPDGMMLHQAEFCKAVDEHDMTAKLTAFAQCSANAVKSDECATASTEMKLGGEMFALIDNLCLEECVNVSHKTEAMGKCFPEKEETDEEHDDSIVEMCNIVAGNKSMVACAERVTDCCPISTSMLTMGFNKMMEEDNVEDAKCEEVKTILGNMCNADEAKDKEADAEGEGDSGATRLTAPLLIALLAASHALL